MAKKNRSGNREPRKPKAPKSAKPIGNTLADVIKSRAGSSPAGAK